MSQWVISPDVVLRVISAVPNTQERRIFGISELGTQQKGKYFKIPAHIPVILDVVNFPE